MTATAAASPQFRPRSSASDLLAELEQVHAALRERIAALGAITAEAQPSKMEYTSGRLRLSQASIDRRSALGKALRFLEERGAPADLAAVAKVRAADGELIAHSVAHLAKWTTEAVAADWKGYCEASQSMRDHMLRTVEAEAQILYGLLK
ncbi:MAG TPA: hypothetical protein VFW39_04980 [Sphingomicrobium sp.]|nr:hypothetical protein [Sphingomicrobium sp.]